MANRLPLIAIVVVCSAFGWVVAADSRPVSPKDKTPVFSALAGNEFSFDTGVLRGKLRAGGKSSGLSSVVHVPTGAKLDGGAGIVGFYRVFTANKRYGSAAWDWPSEATLLPDGAVEAIWPATAERPFEMTAVYRWRDASTLDIETRATAKQDLSGFEVFLASYFDKTLASPYMYLRKGGSQSPELLLGTKTLGDWLMAARDERAVAVIHDGRWKIEPNPVDWVIQRWMAAPLAVRRDAAGGVTAVVMAPLEDCIAVAMPYEGETHYSLYLSLFGRDVKSGETAKASSRLVIAQKVSDQDVVGLYARYMLDLKGGCCN